MYFAFKRIVLSRALLFQMRIASTVAIMYQKPFWIFSQRETQYTAWSHRPCPPVPSSEKHQKNDGRQVFLALIGELLDWPSAADGCGLL